MRTRDRFAIGVVVVFGAVALIELQVQNSHTQKPGAAPAATSASTPAATSATAPAPAPSRPLTVAEKRKEAAAQAASDERTRIAFAKTFEGILLEDNMDATVTVSGSRHTTLQLEYILVNKPMAYQMAHDHQDLLTKMGSMGFNKFIITDGYDDTWSWKLN